MVSVYLRLTPASTIRLSARNFGDRKKPKLPVLKRWSSAWIPRGRKRVRIRRGMRVFVFKGMPPVFFASEKGMPCPGDRH
jgi:hypothetical protein